MSGGAGRKQVKHMAIIRVHLAAISVLSYAKVSTWEIHDSMKKYMA